MFSLALYDKVTVLIEKLSVLFLRILNRIHMYLVDVALKDIQDFVHISLRPIHRESNFSINPKRIFVVLTQ